MSTSKNSKAGKRSGFNRAKAARLRQFFVLAAFEKLKPTYQIQPYSIQSIDALEEELRRPPQPKSRRELELELELELDEYETLVPPGPPRLPRSDKYWNLFNQVFSTMFDDSIHKAARRNVSRETLIKDLKALGIKSKLRKIRSR